MKTIGLMFVIAVAFFVSRSAVAQSRFSVEVLGGESFNALNEGGYLGNWGNGWTIGGGVAYRASPNVNIGVNLSYNYYPFRGGHLELVFPAIAGLRYSVSGKPSTAEEASLVMRFTAPTRFVTPYLSVTGGISNFFVGSIDVVQSLGSGPTAVSSSRYTGSGRSTLNFFSAVGLGLLIPVNTAVAVSIEGRFSHMFTQNSDFMPMIAEVQFDL